MAELLLLLAVILPVAYLLSGTSSCRCMYRANITKITVTLLVVLFVPDMGEEGEGISVSLTHYSIGQLPCRGLNESYFFFFFKQTTVLAKMINFPKCCHWMIKRPKKFHGSKRKLCIHGFTKHSL